MITRYLPLVGPYSTHPTIYVHTGFFGHVTQVLRYDCSEGCFVTVTIPPKDLHRYSHLSTPCRDTAVATLIRLIQSKGYYHKSPHFEAFAQHWPELFI